MKIQTLTPKQLRGAERTLSAGTWTITFGAILYSVLTVTPLVERVTPDGWGWTAPILPAVVDAAVVIVIRLDATVARLGGDAGKWPSILRWLTGLMTIALNIGDSALKRDWVGVAVHVVAPTLLIVTGEAGLAYRRAITNSLERIEREQREETEREQAQSEARERRAREEREQQRDADERREREAREHAERLEQDRADREARERREEREHQATLAREQADREDRQAREQRQFEQAQEEARERRERSTQQLADREREQRQADEALRRERSKPKAVNTAKQAPVNTTKPKPVNTTAKWSEESAHEAVRTRTDLSVRELADLTGWSIGWVSNRRNELPTMAEVA